MGANLVPRVMGFRVAHDNFVPGAQNKQGQSIEDGCITPGKHKVIWFSLHLDNIGDANFHIGKPAERQDVFTPPPQPHFKEKFYTWRLTDNAGTEKKTGFKVAFCLMDFPPREGGYNCENQGVSVGSHDEYNDYLPCQFIEADNLPDGTYTLHVTANAYTVQQVKNGQAPLKGFEEDNYDDNTISVQLALQGDNVTVV